MALFICTDLFDDNVNVTDIVVKQLYLHLAYPGQEQPIKAYPSTQMITAANLDCEHVALVGRLDPFRPGLCRHP